MSRSVHVRVRAKHTDYPNYLNDLMRKFKKQCEKEGIITEIKKRSEYEKPSAKRRRKALKSKSQHKNQKYQ